MYVAASEAESCKMDLPGEWRGILGGAFSIEPVRFQRNPQMLGAPMHKLPKLLLIFLAFLPANVPFQTNAAPVKIIFETDYTFDCDDVGALAILHVMADEGEVELLAVCYNEVHKDGAAAIDAVNTWYGRGDIPIGVYKGNLSAPDPSVYLSYVADTDRFPSDITTAEAPSALDVYHDVLSAQPDNSVSIVSVGFLNNLSDLVNTYSDLVEQKVVELVQMAGLNGGGFNIDRHGLTGAACNVMTNWPTKLVVTSAGGRILTGDALPATPEDNPVREAYSHIPWVPHTRPSWDQISTWYAIKGYGEHFTALTSGSAAWAGGCGYTLSAGYREYASPTHSDAEIDALFEEMMARPPTLSFYPRVSLTKKNITASLTEASVDISAVIKNAEGGEVITWSVVEGGGALSSTTGDTVTFTHEGVGTYRIQASISDSSSEICIVNVIDPSTYHVRINCGGGDISGTEWVSDAVYASGGTSFNWGTSPDPAGVEDAGPAEMYGSVRHSGTHSYDFPVGNGDYTVRIHFVDPLHEAQTRNTKYTIEGEIVENNFVLPSEPTVKSYPVTVTDGELNIQCEPIGQSDVFEAGIEVFFSEVVSTKNPSMSIINEGFRVRNLSPKNFQIDLPAGGAVEIMSVNGRAVERLELHKSQSFIWRASSMPAGIYLVRARTADRQIGKRTIVVE